MVIIMRKLKKESKIIEYKGIIAIIERINNDRNGNPRYQVQLLNIKQVIEDTKSNKYFDIENVSFYNNQYYNFTSYDIVKEIKNIIDNQTINNID